MFSLHKHNVLLVKDDVGRAKPTVYNLPSKDFVYGKADFHNDPGVGVILTETNYHKPSVLKEKHVDFRKLNKLVPFNQ